MDMSLDPDTILKWGENSPNTTFPSVIKVERPAIWWPNEVKETPLRWAPDMRSPDTPEEGGG